MATKKAHNKKVNTVTKVEKAAHAVQQKPVSRPRILKGIVTSHVSDKTISVLVATFKVHPKYKKRYRVTRKYLAHDEKNVFKTGYQVVITEHRPISKRKRWIVANKTT